MEVRLDAHFWAGFRTCLIHSNILNFVFVLLNIHLTYLQLFKNQIFATTCQSSYTIYICKQKCGVVETAE